MMMSADDALAAAEAEGLVLERTDARADGSGFIGVRKPTRAWERNGIPAGVVRVHGDRYSRPFEASLQFNAKTTHLAWCATAEQAALLRARALPRPQAALRLRRAAAAAEAGEDEEEKEGMLTAEEALAKAEPRPRVRALRPSRGTERVHHRRRAARTRTRRTTSPSTARTSATTRPRRRPRRRALRGRRRVPPRSARPARCVHLDGPRGAAVGTTAQAAGTASGGVGAGVGVGVGGGNRKRKRAERAPSCRTWSGCSAAAAARQARRRRPSGAEGLEELVRTAGRGGRSAVRRRIATSARTSGSSPRCSPRARSGGGGGREDETRGGGGGGCSRDRRILWRPMAKSSESRRSGDLTRAAAALITLGGRRPGTSSGRLRRAIGAHTLSAVDDAGSGFPSLTLSRRRRARVQASATSPRKLAASVAWKNDRR